MLKILDAIYLGMNLTTLKKDVEDQEAYQKFEKKVIYSGDKSCVWICFPGWNMPIARAESVGFLPNQGTKIVYQGPMSVIGLTPEQTQESLERLKLDVIQTLKEEGLDNTPVKIFGFSAGTLPAFWLANHFKVAKLIAVSPGYRLGEGIFNSWITLETKKMLTKKGWTKIAYDERVAPYNQENNIEHLPVGEVTIFAGKHDTYVPHEHSVILFEKLKAANKNPQFHSFDLLDHVSMALYLGWMNKKGKDPYQLEEALMNPVAA